MERVNAWKYAGQTNERTNAQIWMWTRVRYDVI
jgi:hypothetical protein